MTKTEFVRSRYDAHLRYWARVGLLSGTPLVVGLSLLDLWISPEHFRQFLVYRLVTALGMLGLLLLNELRAARTYQSLLGLVAGAMVSTMLALIVAELGGHRSVYFAGFILVLIFVCSFLPLRLGYGVAAAAIVHGVYLVPILVYDTIVDRTFFVAANVLILMCAGTMLLLQHLSYRRLHAEFLLQYELEQQRSGLEGQVQARTEELSRTVQELQRTMAEREAAAAELNRANVSLQALIASSPVSIVAFDVAKRVTLWNPAAERTLGWSATEVLGRTNPLLGGSEEPEFQANLERLERGEAITDLVIERRTRNWTPVTLRMSAAALRGPDGEIAGYMSVLADITEQRKLERAIVEARDEWEDSFNTINDAITIHDRDFTIVRANKAAEELLGLPLLALSRQKCYQSYHGSGCPPDDCPSCRVLQTGQASMSEIYEPHLKKHLEIKALPRFDRQGRLIGLVHVVRDITEASRLKSQLFQAQKMEAVGQLAGGIAHDFNNIMTAVICFADVLGEKMGADDPLRAYVNEIIAAAERASNLTQSLLAYSRRQIIALKTVELNGVVRDLLKLLARLIGEDIELKFEPAQRDLFVAADAGLLGQVLMNLATNARDAMPHGGRITIATAACEMDEAFIAARGFGRPGIYALLSVSDTGLGMDEKTREKIFEPFFTTKELGRGTGLGLAMVYGTVKQHNGFIAAESEIGKGTRFKIWIPLVVAGRPQEDERRAAAAPGGNETILVAEDETVLRNILREILEGHGYHVLVAEDGEEAVRLFKEHADSIQLLLLDLVMPKMSGKDAGDEMALLRPAVRTLYMSGHAPDSIAQRELLVPGMNLINKPLSPAGLLQAVRRALDG